MAAMQTSRSLNNNVSYQIVFNFMEMSPNLKIITWLNLKLQVFRESSKASSPIWIG